MPNFLREYKTIVILVCLCTISLFLSWLTSEPVHTEEANGKAVKDGVSTLFAPTYYLSSVISSMTNKFQYLGSVFANMFQKPLEKERLQALEDEVEALNRQLNLQIERNRRLEKQYEVYRELTEDLESGRYFKLLPAQVIAVEPTDWFRYVTIDKGEGDGVSVDMGVITRSELGNDTPVTAGTVVGRVSDVHQHTARVQLITDQLSKIAVTFESLGDLALLTGQPNTENCSINQVPSTAYDLMKIGTPIIVDERSSLFPAGMLVGEISHIEKGTHFCSIQVQPAFRFRRLREVMVILDTRYN